MIDSINRRIIAAKNDGRYSCAAWRLGINVATVGKRIDPCSSRA
jgi:hypothetical protein